MGKELLPLTLVDISSLIPQSVNERSDSGERSRQTEVSNKMGLEPVTPNLQPHDLFTIKHSYSSCLQVATICAECTRAARENWKSGFVSSKSGPEVTIGSMAIYQESESHGVQIG